MPKRTDANQNEIVKALRAVGVSVAITSDLGDGFVDIVCGYHGVNYLIKIKDGSKPPSQRKLTDKERIFHMRWRGQIAVAESVEDAMRIVGVVKNSS